MAEDNKLDGLPSLDKLRNLPSLDELSSEEDKKKVQTEETQEDQEVVQEDTELPSEDGSSESLEDKEEDSLPADFKQIPQSEDVKLGDTATPIGLEEFYKEDVSEERKDEIAEVGRVQKEMEQKALYDRTKIELDKNLPDFDFLSKTTEDIIDELPAEVDDNTAFQIIEENKNKAVKKLGEKDYERRLKLDETNFLGRGFSFEDARELAEKRQSDLKLKEGLRVLDLSDDDVTEYRKDIFDLNALMNIPRKDRSPQEQSELISLLDKTSKLREDSNSQFINPETGKVADVDQEAVMKLVPEYEKEIKTDFQKFSKRYTEEHNNIEALRHRLLVSNMQLPVEERSEANDRDFIELSKSMNNFTALSRALLLNENPAAVSRGFEFLEGTWFENVGSFATSFGESFVEAIPGAGNVTTDRDFRKTVVDIANQEGVKLSEEQYDSAVDGMSEQLGDTFGTSAEIMAEIMVTSLITKNVSGALKVSDKLGRLVAGLGGGKKTARFAGEALKAVEQAVAFDLTSQGSAAMGLGEFFGAKGGEKLLNLLSKGKSGKLLKILKPLTRIMGATAAGTIEEYSGEYLDQAFRNGLLSEETFKNTFGRDYDEAKDKLLMTMILSGTFGTGAEFANMYKLGKDYYSENGDTQQLNDVEKAYNEIIKTKEQTAVKKFDDMSDAELEQYAKDNDVDVSEVKSFVEEQKTKEETEEEEIIVPEVEEVVRDDVQEVTEGEVIEEVELSKKVEEKKEEIKDEEIISDEVSEIKDEVSLEEEVKTEGDTFTQEEVEEQEEFGTLVENFAKDVESVEVDTEESLQKEFTNDVNNSSKFLSEAKRKQANRLISSVKDLKSYNEARKQLGNLIEYGKKKPKTSDIVTAKTKQVFEAISPKKLTERIIKAQNKAGRETLKNKKKLFKEIAKELGYSTIPSNISTRKAISLMRELNALDATNAEKVADFTKRLDKVLSDKVQSDKKTSLKKRIRKLAKKARKSKGSRNDIAKALNNINLNKVESIDKAEQLVDALDESFSVKGSIKDKAISDKMVESIRALEKEQDETNQMLLEDAYEKSDAKKYGLSMESFKELLDASEERKAELRKKQSEARALKTKEEKKTEYNNEVEKLNEYANEVSEEETSEDHVKRVKKLQKALGKVDVDSLTDSQLTEIYNAMEEAIALDSSAGVSKASSVLNGVSKAKSISEWSNKGAKFKKPLYSIAEGLTTSWDSFSTSVTKRIEDGFEFTAKILGEFDSKWNDTVEQSNNFNEGVDKILSRKKLFFTTEDGVSLDSSHKLGVISDLLQHESESTSTEIQEEFEAKKKKLDAEIEYYDSLQESKGLSRSEKRKYARLSGKLKEARDVVSKYDTPEALQSDLGNVLSDGELELYNYALAEFEKSFDDFKNTHYAKNGKDVKRVSNYIPTYKRNRKTGKGELESGYDNSMSAKDSGRTVRRQPVKTDGSVLSNYDFISNIKNGMQDILYDVNTMESRMELDQLLKSKDYLEMFDKLPGLDKQIKQRLKVIFDARTPRPSTDSVMRNKFAEAGKSYYRGWKSSNLKNFTQLAKQYVPIMASTSIETGVQNTAKGLSMSASTDPKMVEYVEKIINLSALKNRVQLGDASFDASETLISKLLRNAYNPKGGGNAILNLYKKLNDDVLGASDKLAFKHSLLASYVEIMSKKGGIDITKEPSLEDVAKADALANTINNASDPTKAGTFWQDRNFKPVRDLLFLYGSFAHNQTTQAFQALGNSVRYGDKKAVKKFIGAYVGMMAFYAIGDQLRDILSLSSDYLFGDDDDKPLKGESSDAYKKRVIDKIEIEKEEERKTFIDYLKDYSKYAAADLSLGTMPNVE
jgi:hypothetical protein